MLRFQTQPCTAPARCLAYRQADRPDVPTAAADPWTREKMENMALLLGAAQAARDKVGLKMNIPSAKVDPLLEKLPALRNPTISKLAHDDWVAIETVLDEAVVREIIPELKALGAEGIIEYPLNKLVE